MLNITCKIMLSREDFYTKKESLKHFNYLTTFQPKPPKREVGTHWLVWQAPQTRANSAFQLLTVRAEQALIKANSSTRDSKGSGRQKELMHLNTELASRKQAKMLTSKEPPSAGGIHSPLEALRWISFFVCLKFTHTSSEALLTSDTFYQLVWPRD